VSTSGGGHLIELEDEDPKIRSMFQEEIESEGIPFNMPPVTYRR
jgi:hypothetical protein